MSRQGRIVAVLIVGFFLVTVTIVYLEVNKPKMGELEIHVSALQTSIAQGTNLTIILNVSARDISGNFKINGDTYLGGIKVAYYGTNKSAAEESGPAMEYGLAKYILNSVTGVVKIHWNSTVENGLNYTLAPAGYYRLFEGGNIEGGEPSDTTVNFSVANQTISVNGVYGAVAMNSTNVSIAALPFGITAHPVVNVNISVSLNEEIINQYSFSGTVPIYECYLLKSSVKNLNYETEIYINTPRGIILMVENVGLTK